MTLAFLYMSKYLDYEGSHLLASCIQFSLFYIAHQMFKNILQCFGVDINEYHNLSLPDMEIKSLKQYILSL